MRFENIFPTPDDLTLLPEWAFSPIRQGRLYDVTMVTDPKNRSFILKRLSATGVSSVYHNESMSEVFDTHRREHEVWTNFMGEFILETTFLKTDDSFLILQPYIPDAVQFKEVLDSGRDVPKAQLPSISKRTRFISGLAKLIGFSYPDLKKLPDFDFLLIGKGDRAQLKVFDTNYFWFPKTSQDLIKFRYRLSKLKDLLFSNEDLNLVSVQKALKTLDNSTK